MPTVKAYRGLPLEGMLATWYARNTAKLQADFAADARRIAAHLPAPAEVLEVAPGPGYLAVALARLGPYRVTGLDISHSFVRMARAHAAQAGVAVDFQHGNAAELPFADESFDFVVCRAAFKNFTDPVGAVTEMHRVLRGSGRALIIDMRNDASDSEIDTAVDGMQLDRVNAFITRATFKRMLRKRAYSAQDFQAMAAATPFGRAALEETLIGYDVWLAKRSDLTK